ncbi:MAG: biotin carboxylase N-terminal domain-containing protein, partial [Candidatus Eremiobacterota bacterium]
MIRALLVANRGEIACRVARTCRALGIRTVGVFAPPDRGALHTRQTDEAVEVPSYLDVAGLLEAARRTGADAVHPGFGFLAESAEFADAVQDAGLVWVGPQPQAIRAMGDKGEARRLAAEHGVPVIPGAEGDTDEELLRLAPSLGFPVMIKAAAGGGGKGMRLAADAKELAELLPSCRREAESAFGSGRLMLEKALRRPRHVEVQVFGDHHGNLAVLGDRDCSLQRRHQKVLEEAPAPGLSEELRRDLHAAALEVARAVQYASAGTVEFLVQGEAFYFLEMNTRLQVEHP